MYPNKACEMGEQVRAVGVEGVDGVVEERPKQGGQVKRSELGLAPQGEVSESLRSWETIDQQVLTR